MKYYLDCDKNGDIFIFNELPTRRNIEGFWCSNGDEEKVFNGEYRFCTTIGRLMNIPDDILFNITWEDEPIEISINITRV